MITFPTKIWHPNQTFWLRLQLAKIKNQFILVASVVFYFLKKMRDFAFIYLEEPYVQSLTTFCPWNFVIFIKNFYFLIIWHKRSSISIQLLDIDICVTLFHCNSTLCYKVLVVVFFFLWVINKPSSQQCNIRYHQNWKTLLKTYL